VFRGLLETLASNGALVIDRETLEELEKVYLEERTELDELLEYIEILRHGLQDHLTEDEIEEARARASKELGMELEKTTVRGLFGEAIEYGIPRCVYVYLKALADVIERRTLKRINEEIAWVLEKKQETQG